MNALAQPQDCCRPCETPETVSVPGPTGTPGTQWTSGAGAPNNLVGSNGDFYVNTTTGGVYQKIAGVYVLLFVTIGTNGTSITVYQQAGEPMAAIPGDIWISPTDVQVKQPDLTWVSIVGPTGPAGGVITTTKGDLITDDGATSPVGSPVRLGVGADGKTLHSNSAQPYGIGWQTFDLSGANSLITGEVPIANGGTGANTAATARTALGLGTIATQAANSVAITGGVIDGTAIGGTTRAAGKFTTLDANGAAVLSANLTNSAKLFFPASTLQTLAAANVITPNATRVKVVGNAAPVTLTTTPTITAPAADGQLLIVQGNDNTNTITVQDESSLAGSKLKLGAANRVLGKGDTLVLIYDSTDAFWYELAFVNVT